MEVAELFDTGTGIDLAAESSQARVDAYGKDGKNPLAAALRGSPLVSEACVIVDFLLEDFEVSERAHAMLKRVETTDAAEAQDAQEASPDEDRSQEK